MRKKSDTPGASKRVTNDLHLVRVGRAVSKLKWDLY